MLQLKYRCDIGKDGKPLCVFDTGDNGHAYYHQRVELTPAEVQAIIDYRNPAPFAADPPNPEYGKIMKYHGDSVLIESIPTSELCKAIKIPEIEEKYGQAPVFNFF